MGMQIREDVFYQYAPVPKLPRTTRINAVAHPMTGEHITIVIQQESILGLCSEIVVKPVVLNSELPSGVEWLEGLHKIFSGVDKVAHQCGAAPTGAK